MAGPSIVTVKLPKIAVFLFNMFNGFRRFQFFYLANRFIPEPASKVVMMKCVFWPEIASLKPGPSALTADGSI